ncbi:esterase/lipase superfamily enzyme [Rhodobacter sp. JA431]|uniref:alpha/beta hydrolase n=1 Tax=Rhodobacter sp. JA431 TaxID=570013 RepID=UPI000BD8DEBC|nr:alpha/beta fold hydrolase [Rhodobacter sp. JA431]SOC08014.1 esterase/lipase superfamily enzyme [Rhodobacter sp. JA431]
MRRIFLAVFIVLLGCSPRGELAFIEQAPGAEMKVFVGSTRGLDPQTGAEFGYERSETLQLARFDVSIPPERAIGDLRYPLKGRRVDPMTDFAISKAQTYPASAAFRADLRRSLRQSGGDAVVFVHGFNTNFAEGIYRLAQMGEDFELPETLVHYAWPSRGHMLGYAYDRDSALFARDGLQELLQQMRRSGARKILLVAHSMGSALSMETLRQMALSHDSETLAAISSVVLISPDIDVDVFREQARSVGKLPQPFVIFTSKRDKALKLSSQIAGEAARLGNLKDVARVADLKVTLIDVGAFNTRDGHFNVANNPALIKLLQNTGQVAKILEGEQATRTNLASGVVMTVENATEIILSPITALGGG